MFKKECKCILLSLSLGVILTNVQGQANGNWQAPKDAIATRWTKMVNPSNVLPEYPRPQLVRNNWTNLNGLWEYAVTQQSVGTPDNFSGNILVPYPFESALSGVKKRLQPDQWLWYKRSFTKPVLKPGERLLLHFGAVDFEAVVFINDKELGSHKGGYQHFSIDVTDALTTGKNNLVVRVWDPTDKGPNPHGKQVLNPEGIMYTPSSGIWQTVWLEVVPQVFVQSLKITPDVDKHQVRVDFAVNKDGKSPDLFAAGSPAATTGLSDYTVELNVKKGTTVVTSVKQPLEKSAYITLQNARLWSPDDPFLYDLQVKLWKGGKLVDEVTSYFGMRKVDIQKDKQGVDRIFLNNQYTYNLGTLDQGFWPDGLYTAPTDAALKFDIEAAKAMGFNTIRKHIKIEPDRWYYYADKLGMLVWQDMVNPGNDAPAGHSQFEQENKENVAQLYNHPSIVTWVLFNEKWGQYDQERLTNWFKAQDPTRLINGHSGEMLYVNDQLRSPSPNAWVAADMTDVHSYPFPRNAPAEPGKARVLGEFGGIGVPVEGHLWSDLQAGWGYDGVVSPSVMQQQYKQMADSLKVLERLGLSASIYTQPFDVESEQNGIITYDRAIIKLPVATIRSINAQVWPATKNFLLATKGFSASVADTVSKSYAVRLKEYQQGKKDSAFLRALTVLADAQKDPAMVEKLAAEHISQMKNPLSEVNLKFIMRFTNTTRDPGFAVLYKNVQKVNEILGKDEAESKITAAIEKDEINPYLPTDGKPDWTSIEKRAITKYGDLGKEIVWQTKVFYAANHQDWDGFGLALRPWFEKYGSKRKWITSGTINALGWAAFENTTNRNTLEAALVLTSHGVQQEEQTNLLDTHANLLYKLGKKQEALHWEEKALTASNGDAEIQNNYEKMKRDEPTWPRVN
ncbi:glycoside hydrolase family 2 [Chitinophaga pinensis]|uniref:Glycoside hydrolase family 2 sugar binding n=1 Tax=Chitinophaga pinensis (strain ATCC 43595 / DSM 2588 / LMG 13176 / NBRC 15968 / NCIMB 11800 / UQM 2034) TaxID=485918 RepID=A0A979G4P6_CHIPD|nr:glycoside hydrolase family 2 [Chitinophaga pinensis]ACU60661.1 glycoside hydrolase family 2 sugar binding [Chitinophaga pinensis DSM 2588]